MSAPDRLSDTDRAAVAHIEAGAGRMLDRTLAWARINTGSWNGEGLRGFAPLLAQALGDLDAAVETIQPEPVETLSSDGAPARFETGPILRARARPEAKVQIVLTGHYDTVYPPGAFETVEDIGGGRVRGPGVADMKGGLAVMLAALEAFEAGKLKDRLGYRIVLSPDEEIGNPVSAPVIAQAAAGAQIGMTYEPALEGGAMAGARKGVAKFDIVFRGRAAHAGRAPETGRSALLAAADFILALGPLAAARDGVVFNAGRIDGGGPVNMVPDLAIVRLGARAPRPEDADWAVAALRRVFDDVLARHEVRGDLRGGFHRPPKPRGRAQARLFDAVAGAGRAIGLDLQFLDTGGACEGNNVFAAGVPNIDTLGVRGGAIHSHDEYLVADSLVERASLSALILNRLADGRIDAAAIHGLMAEET